MLGAAESSTIQLHSVRKVRATQKKEEEKNRLRLIVLAVIRAAIRKSGYI
jgi:hypothetical protein